MTQVVGKKIGPLVSGLLVAEGFRKVFTSKPSRAIKGNLGHTSKNNPAKKGSKKRKKRLDAYLGFIVLCFVRSGDLAKG